MKVKVMMMAKIIFEVMLIKVIFLKTVIIWNIKFSWNLIRS